MLLPDAPEWLCKAVEVSRLRGGMAWSIRSDKLELLRRIFLGDASDWEQARNEPWSFVATFECISVQVEKYELADKTRVLFSRLDGDIFHNESTFRFFLEQWAGTFSAIPGAVELTSLEFHREIPPTP